MTTQDDNLTEEMDSQNIVLEEIHHNSSDTGDFYVNSRGKTKYKKHKRKNTGYKHKSSKKKIAIIILIGVLIFLLAVTAVLAAIFFHMKSKGKKELLSGNEASTIHTIDDASSDNSGHTVIYNGETYTYNPNVISIVFLGIDKSSLDSDTLGTAGQADAIYIFTYDTVLKYSCIIPVSRETMTDIDVYSVSGNYVGTKTEQICLSYAYGDGKELSCNNTLKSLSRLFFNIPFNNYVSVNWDIVGPLSDAIGGVSLTPIESISTGSVNIVKDKPINLMDDDAFAYVRYRNYLEDDTNKYRIARQKQYISAYLNQLIPEAKNDISIVSKLYGIASDYMFSNISMNQMVYIASTILPSVYSAKDIPFKNIEGTVDSSNSNDEFYMDNTSLYETVLNIFYTKQ